MPISWSGFEEEYVELGEQIEAAIRRVIKSGRYERGEEVVTQPPEIGPESELGSGQVEGGRKWQDDTTDPRRSSPS